MSLEIEFKEQYEIEESIKYCQEFKHIQQVAFSTFHHALTQICFSCGKIRTSIKEDDLK